MSIREYFHLFVCPQCRSNLKERDQALQCTNCQNRYPFTERMVDFLPPKALDLKDAFSDRAHEYYAQQFTRDLFAKMKKPQAWGAWEYLSAGYKVFEQEEQKIISRYYSTRREVFGDISAGAGYYSFSAAKHFTVVFHCDLNAEYLQFAKKKAQEEGLENIFFCE